MLCKLGGKRSEVNYGSVILYTFNGEAILFQDHPYVWSTTLLHDISDVTSSYLTIVTHMCSSTY